MFDIILNPFVTALTFLYSVLGNNVVLAIVVFTILIRLVTFPLTMQQQRSTKAMQELQPELKKLQKKYKDDKEKLSQEQMRLYKEHGVNPLGGCLPLIIQFPILIGLYQAILFALAASPLGLVNLSGRFLVPGLDHLVPLNNQWLGMNLAVSPTDNPQYALALPVIVVITTFIQSKMTVPATPPPDDEDKPNQAAAMTQSMTTIMPLMFGFFALSFSVGLSLYFIVSNLVGIAQYSLTGNGDIRRVFKLGSDDSPSKPAKKSKSGKTPKAKKAQ
ncbi:MAG: membrane protein insertase YidC [Chloroflexi bacterium]|nr:MAG: hypothetical protein CUN54_04540 [Phototrophicales bacterium]RMF82779.1 MAG: membrane protein insertase YidC [Chloroflexota bacterium]